MFRKKPLNNILSYNLSIYLLFTDIVIFQEKSESKAITLFPAVFNHWQTSVIPDRQNKSTEAYLCIIPIDKSKAHYPNGILGYPRHTSVLFLYQHQFQ